MGSKRKSLLFLKSEQGVLGVSFTYQYMGNLFVSKLSDKKPFFQSESVLLIIS